MGRKILEWILERPAIVVVVLVFVGQIVRAVLSARKTSAQHEAHRDNPAEERRVREVQEKIRRQIAERRGKPPALDPPPLVREPAPPPVARPETTQMPDPFGGPLGRMLEELQKRVQPAPVAPPVIVEQRTNAELERQQQLADELRSLEESRVLVERRAASSAAEKQATAQAEPELRSVARVQLLGDLNDPQSLRRAFVLREVLGPPIGLR